MKKVQNAILIVKIRIFQFKWFVSFIFEGGKNKGREEFSSVTPSQYVVIFREKNHHQQRVLEALQVLLCPSSLGPQSISHFHLITHLLKMIIVLNGVLLRLHCLDNRAQQATHTGSKSV